MTEHLPGAIEEYFSVGDHLLSTRSADAYRAVDRSRDLPIFLWLLRHPLALNSDAVRRYLGRMHVISSQKPSVTEMTAFGIDAHGIAFSVFPNLDGAPVGQRGVDRNEGDRRFVACVRLIESLHANQILCGDLCGSSFWLTRGGDVRFVGVMGSFDSEAAATAMLPPAETLHYLAPEQRMGGGIEAASDVFALGVLGYYLVTRSYPFGDRPPLVAQAADFARITPPSKLAPDCPGWADEVLLRALAFDPAARFSSAVELAAVLRSGRVQVDEAATMPSPQAERPKEIVVQGERLSDLQARQSGETFAALPDPGRRERRARWILGAAITAALAAGVALVPLLLPLLRRDKPAPPSVLDVHEQVAGSAELKHAIQSLNEDDTALAERSKQLDKIVRSDDPIAHDVLVRSALEAKSVEERTLSEKAVIDRARRLGLMRASEQVRQWLNTLRGDQDLPANYEPLLRALDTSIPMDARGTLLRRAYALTPRPALRLGAALALDLDALEAFQPLMAQLVGDDQHFEGIDQRSTLALILAHPDLVLEFGNDAVQRREQLPDADILWVIDRLALRNDIHVRAFASAAIERGLISPMRQVFFSTIRERGDLPADVIVSLVRAGTGSLRAEDVNAFGRWYDLAVEKVLLAICAEPPSPEIGLEAFDTLAGRTITLEPTASVVEWIRQHAWKDRQHFVRAVGILAFLEILPRTEILQAFEAFDSVAKDRDLLEIFISTNNPTVVELTIQKYAKLLSTGRLLGLLGSQEKSIRVSAIQALTDTNDIGALKMIIDAYERESDPDVRALYKDKFWMIKQRQEQQGAPPS